MTEVGTVTKPIRLLVDDLELASGDLEIVIRRNQAGEVTPECIGLALRDVLAELVEQLTTEYDHTGKNMSTLEQPVSVGRIVFYQHYGTPGGEFPPKASAALVTGVRDDGTVSLTVFTDDGGIHPHAWVRHDEGHAGGTWHWPPRILPPAGASHALDASRETLPPSQRPGGAAAEAVRTGRPGASGHGAGQ